MVESEIILKVRCLSSILYFLDDENTHSYVHMYVHAIYIYIYDKHCGHVSNVTYSLLHYRVAHIMQYYVLK